MIIYISLVSNKLSSYHDLSIINYVLNYSAIIFESIVSRKFDVGLFLLYASILRGC